MACGLEVRAPFLDAELVDRIIAAAVVATSTAEGRTKRLLKAAAAGRLPASILERPKKGFGIPVARWLRGPLCRPARPTCSAATGSTARASSDPRRSPGWIAEHRAGARDHRKPLWTLLMFQLWHDRWLE